MSVHTYDLLEVGSSYPGTLIVIQEVNDNNDIKTKTTDVFTIGLIFVAWLDSIMMAWNLTTNDSTDYEQLNEFTWLPKHKINIDSIHLKW